MSLSTVKLAALHSDVLFKVKCVSIVRLFEPKLSVFKISLVLNHFIHEIYRICVYITVNNRGRHFVFGFSSNIHGKNSTLGNNRYKQNKDINVLVES